MIPIYCPPGAQLQLTPEEYLPGGYFATLTRWLDRHLGEYGFYRPYARDRGGVAGWSPGTSATGHWRTVAGVYLPALH